jgi:RNA polymerase sigma-70 factor (ECF subfamily)
LSSFSPRDILIESLKALNQSHVVNPETAASTVHVGLFAATQWSVVLRAKDKSEAALDSLFGQYRGPLLIWLLRQGYTGPDAEDVLHGFMHSLLHREALSGVASENGKFRTFLLKCLKNYLRDEHDRAIAAKRGGGRAVESLDQTDETGRIIHEPASDDPAPDVEYDRAWAESVLANSLRRLQDETGVQGHAALYAAIEPVMFCDDTASPYREIGVKLGMSEGAVKMAASRIRTRLKGLVREQIMQTVANEQDWQEEVRYLIQLFARQA